MTGLTFALSDVKSFLLDNLSGLKKLFRLEKCFEFPLVKITYQDLLNFYEIRNIVI